MAQHQHQVALARLRRQDGAGLVALFGGLAQQRFHSHGGIEQIRPGLALEAREAVKILNQALAQIPAGPIQAGKKGWQTRVPAGEVYARIEHPKGELGFYLVSNGTGNPWRYRVRSPSFINLTALGEMCKGLKVADAIVILGALDIVLGEVDR